MKRINIILSEELHTKFKIACTLEGTEMSDLLRKCIEDYVARVGKRKVIPLGKEEK